MRIIKRVIGQTLIFGTLMATLGGATLAASPGDWGVPIQKVRVSYQQRRPFSWYYPYRFQYYYPSRAGDSCSWVYTNGAYVYNCN